MRLIHLLSPAPSPSYPSYWAHFIHTRVVLRIDSLLRSALSCHFDDQSEHFWATPYMSRQRATSAPSPSSTSTPQQVRENRSNLPPERTKEANKPDTTTQAECDVPSSTPGHAPLPPVQSKESGGSRGAWLLWAFYAKFAERCLNDPPLALYALDKAVAVASTRFGGALARDRRRRGSGCSSGGHTDGRIGGMPLNCEGNASSLALVARAQFYQRFPKLFDGLAGYAAGFRGGGASCSPEELFMEVTHR